MADYYPLIAKAVTGLDKSTGEARRELYTRARNALVTQLRGVVPALSETDITRERLALEEAIRKVEAEAARKSRFDPPPERRRVVDGDGSLRSTGAPDSQPPAAAPQDDPDDPPFEDPSLSGTAAELRRPSRTPGERAPISNDGLKGFRDVVADAENLGEATAEASRTARQAYNAMPSPSPEFDRIEPRLEPEGLRARERRPPPAAREAPRDAAPRDAAPREPAARDSAPRDVAPRDLAPREQTRAPARDAAPRENLREAPREASREALREAPQREAPKREAPREAPPSRQPAQMREPPPVRGAPPARDPAPRDPAPRDPAPREPVSRERAPPPRDPRDRSPRDPNLREPVPDFDLPSRNDSMRGNEFSARDFGPLPDVEGAPDAGRAAARKPTRRQLEMAADDHDAQVPPPMRTRQRLVAYASVFVAVVLVVGAVAGLAIWQWQPMVSTVRGWISSQNETAPSAPRDTPQARQKITDRIGTGDAGQAGAQAGAEVAQRVVLYEEDPADPAGKRYVGSTVWRTESVTAGAGQPPETVVRADIDIPERKMTMKWSLRRNLDKTLPASHTVEVVFTLPPDFPHGGIQNIPGVLMKQSEQARGVPLAGLAVKVTTNYFLIGLSAVDSEMQRNIQLLKERPWFDVPIVYNDGRRAILAVEKGTPGERAFNDAFAAWKQ